MSAIGIIGGTGLSSLDPWINTSTSVVQTRYGDPSAALSIGEWNAQRVVFLPRHGSDRSIPPHKINYRANIRALKDAGVGSVVSISAVGGISADAAPGNIIIPHQIVDYTYGRQHTFFDGEESTLNHIDFTQPYSGRLRSRLLAAASQSDTHCGAEGVYGATQGPRLETAAEINRMERDGCTLVGMTGMPEAALARELNMEYACCAIVVNWAAGRSSESITMETIKGFVMQGQEKLNAIFNQLFAI